MNNLGLLTVNYSDGSQYDFAHSVGPKAQANRLKDWAGCASGTFVYTLSTSARMSASGLALVCRIRSAGSLLRTRRAIAPPQYFLHLAQHQ